MKTSKALIMVIYSTFCIESIVIASKSKWLDDYISYLKNDHKEYQVMLLFHQNRKNVHTKVEDIIFEISRNVPTLKLSFEEATIRKSQELSELPSFQKPQTTIFVLIHLTNTDPNIMHLNRPIEFLTQLSEPRSRPKILIILPQEEGSSTYLKLLERMWSRRFLDVSIIELIETKTKGNFFTSTSSKELAIIHQFNPFSKTYSKQPYHPKLVWFPEKTRNLHENKIKVGIFHMPPEIYLEKNRSNHTINVFGTEILIIEGFSKAMNFKIEWVTPKKQNSWGIPACPRENSTGHFYRLMHNEINFLAVESARFASCDEVFYEWTRGTGFQSAVIVIPILPDTSQISTNWKLFNALVVLGLFLTIWLISRKLPFERQNWSLTQILEIILAMGTDHEPQNLAERIIFGSMLVSCLLHSSVIYTALTDVSLSETPTAKIESIDDVLSSNLHPVISNTFHAALYEGAEESSLLLLDKSTQITLMSFTCMKQLVTNKSLSCITMTPQAKWMVETERKSNGEHIMQTVKEPIRSLATGYMLEYASPYVGRFDEVLLRFFEAGITGKWRRTTFNGSSVITHTEILGSERGSESSLIYKQMSFVLICGYSCALISFVCEKLIFLLRKRLNGSKVSEEESKVAAVDKLNMRKIAVELIWN